MVLIVIWACDRSGLSGVGSTMGEAGWLELGAKALGWVVLGAEDVDRPLIWFVVAGNETHAED